MAPITLEQFKTGWELGLEVGGGIDNLAQRRRYQISLRRGVQGSCHQ